jgi:hypothetical protein
LFAKGLIVGALGQRHLAGGDREDSP